MTNIEVSINMSHYNAWQKLITSCKEYALILEDDIELKRDFVQNVNSILDHLELKKMKFSILHLWNGNWARTKTACKNITSVNIVDKKIKIIKETREYNAGAAAYIISREYAIWLSDHFFPIEIPQDILMGLYVKHGNHLSLKMKWNKEESCYQSPLLDMPCGGEGGTGSQTTQQYDADLVDELNCPIHLKI
jgi:GR25 family glycosyltransferase involved in LPS biosynthesis